MLPNPLRTIATAVFCVLAFASYAADTMQHHETSCMTDSDCGIHVDYHCCGIHVEAVYGKSFETMLPKYPEVCTYSEYACHDVRVPFAWKVACENHQCKLVTETQKPEQCLQGQGYITGCINGWVEKSKDIKLCDLHRDARQVKSCQYTVARKTQQPQYCPDDFCLELLATDEQYYMACEYHSNPYGCIKMVVNQANDPSLCQLSNDSDRCIDEYAIEHEDKSLCQTHQCRQIIETHKKKKALVE